MHLDFPIDFQCHVVKKVDRFEGLVIRIYIGMTILFQQSCQPHFPVEFMSKLTIALTAPQRTYLGGGKCRTDLSGSKIRMPGGKMLWLDVNN